MKIRITGTPAETDAAVDALRAVLNVLEVSGFYPNRGDSQLGRVYIEAQAKTEGPARKPQQGTVLARKDQP